MSNGAVVVVGGTNGIGLDLVRHYAEKGAEVWLTGRDAAKAQAIAADVGPNVHGIGVDLTKPKTIAAAFADIGAVDKLVITAIIRDTNFIKEYDIDGATDLVVVKLVGYPEVIHTLLDRMSDDTSIVLFGGLAKERPYPGSTTVSSVNGGISTMVNTLVVQLAPMRINAIHPSIVGDSWYWVDKPAEVLEGFRSRTPIGRLITQAEVVDATVFLLENGGMNGQNLYIDGGWLLG